MLCRSVMTQAGPPSSNIGCFMREKLEGLNEEVRAASYDQCLLGLCSCTFKHAEAAQLLE